MSVLRNIIAAPILLLGVIVGAGGIAGTIAAVWVVSWPALQHGNITVLCSTGVVSTPLIYMFSMAGSAIVLAAVKISTYRTPTVPT